MPRALPILACLACCASLANSFDKVNDRKITIEASSIAASRKLDSKQFPFFGFTDTLTIQMLVSAPGRQLLAVEQSSKVIEMKDDKGTDLLETKSFFKPTMFANALAIDRSALLVGVQSTDKRPAPGARKVSLKGDLNLLCGLEEKSTDEAPFEFKEKNEAMIGELKIKVQYIPNFGEVGASCTILGKSPIKSVAVKGDEGKDVPINPGVPLRGFNKEWSYNFSLGRKVKEGKVKIAYFTRDEQIKVPVDLQIDLGL